MTADEKQKLLAELARTVDDAGDVLLAEIERLKAEIVRERRKCGPWCRHG